MHSLGEAKLLVDRAFKLGEGPIWDDRRKVLFWTDILAGELWRCGPTGAGVERIYTGPPVGGYTLEEDGRLLLFREDDIAIFDPDGGHVDSVGPFGDPDAERFNDVIATPQGTVLAGTIGADAERGGLYHVTGDAREGLVIKKLWHGTKVANGLGFAPDNSACYWTDSSAKIIFRMTWHGAHASPLPLGERVPWYTGGADAPTPDGMTVDAAGTVYSAQWGGHAVFVLDASGRPTATIEVPFERVTACIFGGEDLATLFITTSQGGVYTWRGEAEGRPEFRTALAR
ncbi:MAG: SMP-30/gluconolactonase/LRE family protein [Planctomycetota bacterium]